MMVSSPPAIATAPGAAGPADHALHRASVELEAGFLAEMLAHAKPSDTGDGFAGGAGERQFSSLLTRAQADHIAQAGGIGLAEAIFHSLKERQGDR